MKKVPFLYGLNAERGLPPPLCALPLRIIPLPQSFVYSLNRAATKVTALFF